MCLKITVIGGGNVGTLISAQFSNKGHQVTLYTRNTTKWHNELIVFDNDSNTKITSYLYKITDNLSESVKDSELIIVTLPAFALQNLLAKLIKENISDKILCFYPGTGGGEILAQTLLDNNVVICGVQRICSVARLDEYGHLVHTTGKRKKIYVGCIPKSEGGRVCKILGDIFDIETELLPNYLNVTLTPSNPILHTSRLYSIFKDYNSKKAYDAPPLFYEEWNNESSEILIKCDNELHNIISKLDEIDLSHIKPLLEHYESHDAISLTNKIKSIRGFKGLKTPSVFENGRYAPDLNSRYFTADFPYGLMIIKAFGIIANTKTPMIDELLRWYQSLIGKNYIDELGNLAIDSKELTLPQNYGIDSIEKVKKIYLKWECELCKQ